ncbi:MAG: hypothetical protein ACFFCW_19865 [Candidatus Hodarchaeota archaeon]
MDLKGIEAVKAKFDEQYPGGYAWKPQLAWLISRVKELEGAIGKHRRPLDEGECYSDEDEELYSHLKGGDVE